MKSNVLQIDFVGEIEYISTVRQNHTSIKQFSLSNLVQTRNSTMQSFIAFSAYCFSHFMEQYTWYFRMKYVVHSLSNDFFFSLFLCKFVISVILSNFYIGVCTSLS